MVIGVGVLAQSSAGSKPPDQATSTPDQQADPQRSAEEPLIEDGKPSTWQDFIDDSRKGSSHAGPPADLGPATTGTDSTAERTNE
ncbi:hypothetical protein FG87_19490 [Nocardia vulneris]|uniref:Secreted protein n=1 Tax=Nocardia vulneris TaxID=1141657 RepID=A0ABR4ZDQ3_9NOCA|nr:hypothetical protein FG87_19490 [Nocardia vulneris]